MKFQRKSHEKNLKFYFEMIKILLTKVGETYEIVRTHKMPIRIRV